MIHDQIWLACLCFTARLRLAERAEFAQLIEAAETVELFAERLEAYRCTAEDSLAFATLAVAIPKIVSSMLADEWRAVAIDAAERLEEMRDRLADEDRLTSAAITDLAAIVSR